MGLIICKKHGGTIIDFTSPRVEENILKKQKMNPNDLSKIKVNLFGFDCVYIFDNQHLEKLGLLGLDSYTIETDEQFSALEVKAVCSKCYREYLEKIGFESQRD